MWLSYGEFCELLGVDHGPESFTLWLRSHALPPHLAASVVAKRRAELGKQ